MKKQQSFFINQLSEKHTVNYIESGDFVVNKKYTFEVGGKDKDMRQIKNLTNAFIVADNIETGYKNKIPLWLFGFLY